MNVVGVIPARYCSTRLEGKVLAKLAGKLLIQHVWERARQSELLDDLLIACDDERVLEEAKAFGAKAVLTSCEHQSGSDRIAEAVRNIDALIVVNIQGDEPLVEPKLIDCLAQALLDDKEAPVATLIKPIEKEEDILDPNTVKVVIDQDGYAMYFSRSAIPYNRDKKNIKDVPFYKHLGLYAYQKKFLNKFTSMPLSVLERTEKLEQLRILEGGYKIKTVMTDVEMIGVDTKEDLLKVENILKRG